MDLVGFRLTPHDLEVRAFGALAPELFTTVWANSVCPSSNPMKSNEIYPHPTKSKFCCTNRSQCFKFASLGFRWISLAKGGTILDIAGFRWIPLAREVAKEP